MTTKWMFKLSVFGWLSIAGPNSTLAQSAEVSGVVIDSIRGGPLVGGPLVGADVVVDGTLAAGHTDSLGRFAIENVPVGRHRLDLFHALLDSLGVAVSTVVVEVHPVRGAQITLSTPSSHLLVSRMCDPAGRDALVQGWAADAESGAAVPGARAIVESTRLERHFVDSASDSIAVGPVIHRDSTIADSSGRFQLCLPAAISARLRARSSRATSGDVPLALAGGTVQMPVLRLAPGDTATGPATLTGRLLDANQKPLKGAIIGIVGTGASTTTSDSGTFQLVGLPEGSRTMTIRVGGDSQPSRRAQIDLPASSAVSIALSDNSLRSTNPDLSDPRYASTLERLKVTSTIAHGWGHVLTVSQLATRDKPITAIIADDVPGTVLGMEDGKIRLQADYAHKTFPIFNDRRIGLPLACTQYVVDGQYWWASPWVLRRTTKFPDINLSDDDVLPRTADVLSVTVLLPGEKIDATEVPCLTVLIWTKAQLKKVTN